MKKPTILITSDWHIRSDSPENRKKDFLRQQEIKIDFILDVANQYGVPIIIAGDVGHIPKWENQILEKYIRKFKNFQGTIFAIPGQHDLPNHRLDKLNESGLGVLIASKVITNLKELKYNKLCVYGYPFGQPIKLIPRLEGARNIAIIHSLISKSKLWDKQENFISAKTLLKKMPCYDLIISGDNHQSFIERYEERLLINPGAIMRMSISQIEHIPKIYLWYKEDNTVKEIKIPIKEGKEVFNLTKKSDEKESNEKLSAFVKSLNLTGEEIKLNFRENLKRTLKNPKNKISQPVKDKIFMALPEDKK